MKKTKKYLFVIGIFFGILFSGDVANVSAEVAVLGCPSGATLDQNNDTVCIDNKTGAKSISYGILSDGSPADENGCSKQQSFCLGKTGISKSKKSVCSNQYENCKKTILANAASGVDPSGLSAETVSGGANKGLANNQSSNGASTAGCETGFDKIGGVCFPTDTGLSEAPITVILGNLFSWVMGLFTMLAIIAFVISGIQYLTAAGDDDRMENGKKNLTFSIIGVLVGLSGFVIVQAIASALSGSTNFF